MDKKITDFKDHPRKGCNYAVLAGAYLGEMLIFIGVNSDDEYEFISIPKNINRVVKIEDFRYGLENGILDVVGDMDSMVFELLQKQFDYNKENDKY